MKIAVPLKRRISIGASTKTRILSDQELKLFFESFNLEKKTDWYYYHVFRIQYLTALRISDMMRLTTDQVKTKHFYIIEKKTGKKREVYLCDEAFTLSNNLCKHAEKASFKHILTKKDDSSYRRSIKLYCKKAKINPDRVSTHSFRKTIANKVSILKGTKAASKLLNHSKLSTTELYLDGSQQSIESAIDLVSGGL